MPDAAASQRGTEKLGFVHERQAIQRPNATTAESRRDGDGVSSQRSDSDLGLPTFSSRPTAPRSPLAIGR